MKQNIEFQYDRVAKKLLSKKMFLAKIMKDVLKEYQDETTEDIIHKYIEKVENDNPTIIGNQSENTYAGKIVYDILFTARKPNDHTNLLIDIEAQKDEPSTYELSTRGVYYSSCLLADQKDKYFKKMNYQDCLKNYSIWIVMNPKTDKRGSIDLFSTERYNLIGNSTYNVKDYDLVNVVMICLDPTCKEDRYDIVGMLSMLFSTQIEVKEKVRRLREVFKIEMDENIEQEMDTMCNLGQGLIEQGKAEGRIEGKAEGRVEGRVEGRIEGKLEGKLEEKNRIFALIRCLMENGEMDKVARLSEDEQLLDKLCNQYHIS